MILIVLAVAGAASAAEPETVPAKEAAASPAATAASAAAPAASGAVAQVCTREQVMGSYRTHTVCYTPGGPNDPNISSATSDLSRQLGLNQRALGRAGGG